MAANTGIKLIERSTLARPDRKYWGASPVSGSPELRYMYSIGLLDLDSRRAVAIDQADPAYNYVGRGDPWFRFPTPPKTYEISEPAATVVIPTQDGGKFIENQGSIFKDISITGTVGFRPNPITDELIPGLASQTGITVNSPLSNITDPATGRLFNKDERGLNPAEITGLDDITFLRNIFRGYWDLKKNDDRARHIVMIWMYAKESEWYIVEPMAFQTSRNSGNPLSWDYSIQLRTLYRYDMTILVPRDSVSVMQSLNNIWNSIEQVTLDLTVVITQIYSAVEFALQLPFNLVGDFLNLATGLLSSIANFRNIGKTASNIKRKALLNITDKARTLFDYANKLITGQEVGDKRVFGSSILGHDAPDPTDDAALDILRNVVRRAFFTTWRLTERLHAMDAIFSAPKQVQVIDYANRYLKYGKPQYLSNSPLDPNNMNIPDSAFEVEVSDTIRGMAKIYLGSEEYWKTLAMINNLKHPYISRQRSDGVLQYGDKILIPKTPETTDIAGVDDTLTDAEKEALSPVVRKYGRDIALSEGSSGTELADLKTGQNGDLQTIEGVPNVQQAMMIKFSTERGELATHPDFGAEFPVGTKVLLGRIQEFAVNTTATLLSDTRVDRIKRLQIFSEGDILKVSSSVKLKQTESTLPINFAVRRG
jgi:hypothetical protein